MVRGFVRSKQAGGRNGNARSLLSARVLLRIVVPPLSEPPVNEPSANESSDLGVPPPSPAPAPEAAAPSSATPSSATPSSSADGAPSGSDGPETPAVAGSGEDPGAGGEGKRRRRRRRRKKGGGGGEGQGPAADGHGLEPGAPALGAAPGLPPEKGPRREKPRVAHEARDQRRRPDRARGRDSHGSNSQHAAIQAVRSLAEMAHALLRVEGVDPLAMPRYLDIQLRVPLDGGNDVRHAAGAAIEQILQRVREVREHEKALRPGAVFSYFAGSSHAEGCRPTEPRHVFDGYSSTGKPQFADFVTLSIERKDPQIERLLAGEEIVLTHVTMGRVLRTQQLAEFGGASPVYRILGQVDAGLFRVLGAEGRCAFSFQLLRGTSLEGRVRLRLHAVGAVEPMDLADPALMQILSRFQRQLDTEALRLEGQLKNGEVDEEAFVLPLLQEFARRLSSRTRHAGRRTQHGLERSEGGQRPTSRAYPDAGEASDRDILWDVDQSTIVVLGPKQRVHVFSPQGKHVTSVVMQGHAVERRRHQGRWRPAEPEERGEFRIRVKQLVASGEGEPSPESDAPPTAGDGS
jgi:hypothetical protein